MDQLDDSVFTDSTDLEDVELIQACSREDLFMLIREDPEYYIKLIKKHKLEHPLSILISRSDDGGGLNLKFRIYPEDRWTEVGYWGDSSDEEVYQDFVTQIDLLLKRSKGSSKGSSRPHLESQLDGNNNLLSPDYGRDIPEIKGKFCQKMKDFSFTLDQSLTSTTTKKQQTEIPSSRRSRLAPENLKETLNTPAEEIEQTPVEFLNKFVAQLLEKIIEQVPKLLEIDPDQNYQPLINQLNDSNYYIPPEYQSAHQQLLDQIKGHQYLQQMQLLTLNWTSLYPELNDSLVSFHRQTMRLNPSPYIRITRDKLLTLLDQEDQTILDQYCLDIHEIWLDYLDHQD